VEEMTESEDRAVEGLKDRVSEFDVHASVAGKSSRNSRIQRETRKEYVTLPRIIQSPFLES
jgi:hypothetical protein